MKGAKKFNKKGQVTIFVILALVIIVLGTLIYFFYPGIKITTSPLEETPQAYFQNCIEGNLRENAELIGFQGGSIEPDSSFNYGGTPVAYLCYTTQPYGDSPTLKCVPQQALLVNHIEEEMKEVMKNKVHSCFDEMKVDYTKKYTGVNLEEKDFNIKLAHNKIILHSDSILTLTKDSPERYENFDVVLNNNLFELASLARTIVAWEAAYGSADPVYFMNYYPNLDIKNPSPDGGKTRIWIIKDMVTGDTFQFASSEIIWPLGIPSP
ncbi:hypothetical protein J4411_02505 [Candidatus Pacearchaeota archaeon]|nr:hypothetical protein [Candidatus Pacearchaeota archaeon]